MYKYRDKKLSKYYEEIIASLKGASLWPPIVEKSNGETVLNAVDTSNRDPYGSDSDKSKTWIRYWQALSGEHNPILKCACCGINIYPDISNDLAKINFNENYDQSKGDTLERHQAHGGHISRIYSANVEEEDKFDGYYIVPLCPACNGKHGKKITIQPNTSLCMEINPVIRE